MGVFLCLLQMFPTGWRRRRRNFYGVEVPKHTMSLWPRSLVFVERVYKDLCYCSNKTSSPYSHKTSDWTKNSGREAAGLIDGLHQIKLNLSLFITTHQHRLPLLNVSEGQKGLIKSLVYAGIRYMSPLRVCGVHL